MSFQNLPQGYTKQQLFDLVLDQIRKDFDAFSIAFHFAGLAEEPLDKLTDALSRILEKVHYQNTSFFMSLMYRIDIRESKVKEALLLPSEACYPALAALVLDRELQRVLTRLVVKP